MVIVDTLISVIVLVAIVLYMFSFARHEVTMFSRTHDLVVDKEGKVVGIVGKEDSC